MGDQVSKVNFCKQQIEYVCTVSRDYRKCKFYKEYAAGGCKHLRTGRCGNTRAWKSAQEIRRAAEYSNTKLTA